MPIDIFEDIVAPAEEQKRKPDIFEDIVPPPQRAPEFAPPPVPELRSTNQPPQPVFSPITPKAPLTGEGRQRAIEQLSTIAGTSPEKLEWKRRAEETRRQIEEAKQATAVASRKAGTEMMTAWDIGEGEGKTPWHYTPFIGGIYEAADASRLFNAANRFERDEATDHDKKLLVDYHAMQQRMGGPSTIGYTVGSILTQLPAFAIELMTTAGIYSGVKKGVEKTALKAAEQVIKRAALKASASAVTKAGKVAGAVAGIPAGAVVQTPLARPGEMVAGAIERVTPGVEVDWSGGQPKITLDDTKADPVETALLKAVGDQYVEVFTEHLGGPFAKALAKVPGAVKIAALKEGIKARWLRRNPSKSVADFLEKIKQGSDWNPVMGEVFEERAGEVLRPALGIEEEYKPGDFRQMMAEGIAFMIPGAAALSIRKVSSEAEAVRRKRRLEQLAGYRGTRQRREEIIVSGAKKDQQAEQDRIVDAIMEAGREAGKILGVTAKTEGGPSAIAEPTPAPADANVPIAEEPSPAPVVREQTGQDVSGEGVPGGGQAPGQVPGQEVEPQGAAVAATAREEATRTKLGVRAAMYNPDTGEVIVGGKIHPETVARAQEKGLIPYRELVDGPWKGIFETESGQFIDRGGAVITYSKLVDLDKPTVPEVPVPVTEVTPAPPAPAPPAPQEHTKEWAEGIAGMNAQQFMEWTKTLGEGGATGQFLKLGKALGKDAAPWLKEKAAAIDLEWKQALKEGRVEEGQILTIKAQVFREAANEASGWNTAQERYKQRKKEKEDFVAQNLKAAGEEGSVELKSSEDATKTILVTPVPGEPGKWRTTLFDNKTPVSHQVFDSRKAAISAASGEAFSDLVAGPPYYTSGEFKVSRVEPTRKNALQIQKEKAEAALARAKKLEEEEAAKEKADQELAKAVLDALRGLDDVSGKDSAGIPVRGGSVYAEALDGKFTPEQLAAARRTALSQGARGYVLGQIETATPKAAAAAPAQPPVESVPAGGGTAATRHVVRYAVEPGPGVKGWNTVAVYSDATSQRAGVFATKKEARSNADSLNEELKERGVYRSLEQDVADDVRPGKPLTPDQEYESLRKKNVDLIAKIADFERRNAKHRSKTVGKAIAQLQDERDRIVKRMQELRPPAVRVTPKATPVTPPAAPLGKKADLGKGTYSPSPSPIAPPLPQKEGVWLSDGTVATVTLAQAAYDEASDDVKASARSFLGDWTWDQVAQVWRNGSAERSHKDFGQAVASLPLAKTEQPPLFDKEAWSQSVPREKPVPSPPKITNATIKAQRKFLLEGLDAAIADAKAEDRGGPGGTDYIQVEVPGDGTFRVRFNKEDLRQFREIIDKGKRMGKNQQLGPFPKGVPAQKESGQKPPGQTTLGQAPKKEPTDEEKVGIAAEFCGTDVQRPNLLKPFSDGTAAVATDGRRMIVIPGSYPGTPKANAILDPKSGKKTGDMTKTEAGPKKGGKATEVTVPTNIDWAKVVPAVGTTSNAGKPVPVDEMFLAAIQCRAAVADEKHEQIQVWLNPDGTFGYKGVGVDSSYERGVQPGARFFAAYHQTYLADIARAAKALGSETVQFEVDLRQSANRTADVPLVVRLPNATMVLMPMRLGEPGTAGMTLSQMQGKKPELNRSNAKALKGAELAVGSFLQKTKNPGIKIVEDATEVLGYLPKGAVATVDGQTGEIILIRSELEPHLDSFGDPGKAQRWLESILTHEAIHGVIERELTQEEVVNLWQSLEPKQKRVLLKDYTGVDTDLADQAGMTAYQAGHEFLRQLLEIKIFGATSEIYAPSKTLFDKFTSDAKKILRRIVEILKSVVGFDSKDANGLVQTYVDRIEAAIQNGLIVGHADSVNERPAALVQTPQRRRAELVAQTVLPAAQVQFINRGIFIQNEAAVGHAEAALNALPGEVRQHLGFIRSRLRTRNEAAQGLGPAGAVQPGPLQQMVASATNNVDEQAMLIFDAWQNTHEIREESARMDRQIASLQKQLDQMRRRGGLQNPLNGLMRNAVDHHRNTLINLRNAQSAAGMDVTPINQEIREMRELRKGTTAFSRIVMAMAAGTPVNPQALSISQAEFNQLTSILNGYPALQPELATIQGTAPTAEVQQLMDTIAQMTAARAFLDTQVMSAQFMANYRFAAQAVGAELAVVDLKGLISIDFQDPVNPGQVIRIEFSPWEGVNQANAQKLVDLANAMEVYLAQPNQDPLRAAAYRTQLYNIRTFYLSSAYSPKVGKLMPNHLDFFHLISLGGEFGTPEGRLERIGGLASARAMNCLKNYAQMHMLARQRFAEESNRVMLAANRAAEAHQMTIGEWMINISDPVLASSQEQGSRHLGAGSRYLGYTITALDMQAIQAQKTYVDHISNAVRHMETTQNRMFPLKIKVEGAIPYSRDPQIRGPLVMPRYTKPIAYTYVQLMDEARKRNREGEISDDEHRQVLRQILGGNVSNQAFYDLVVGHMRSSIDVPTYAMMIRSPFRYYYREMISDLDGADPAAPRSFDAVVQRIFGGQAGVAPEDQLSVDEIMDQFFDEIQTALSHVRRRGETAHDINDPRIKMEIASADNFLTTPRGNQVLPSTLLEYSSATSTDMSRVVGNVCEVLGDRYLESLEQVEKELMNSIQVWQEEIDRLRRAGQPGAAQAVRAQSREQQISGQVWYNLEEARFHLRQVRKSISFMRQITDPYGKLQAEIEEVRGGTKIARGVIATSLLNVPGVVIRNRGGGGLRQAQTDVAMGFSARVFGLTIPYANLIRAPFAAFWKSGVGVMGMLEPQLSHQFFTRTNLGRQMRQAFTAGQNFWPGYIGGMFRVLNDHAQRYERLVELGLTGGAPWWEQLRAYWELRQYGGQLREGDPTRTQAVVRRLESIAGLVYECGVPTGAPRGLFAKRADEGANIGANGFVDATARRMAENAVIYCANREAAGAVLDHTTYFTPEELTGNRQATEKNAAYTRLMFLKAGIHIDSAMIDYYRRCQAAAAAGQPQPVDIFSRAQINSLYMAFSDEFNKGDFSNRPEKLTSSELGRNFGLFLGYGMWYNDRFKIAYSKFSRTPGIGGWWEGAEMTGLWMLYVLLFGLLTEELFVRPLHWFFYREERGTPRLAKAQGPKEAARAILTEAAPFMPVAAQIANSAMEQIGRPTRQTRTGLQLLPVSLYDSVIDTVRQFYETGDGPRAAHTFVRQWFPNTRLINNRMPFYDGTVRYYNVARALRAATPSNIEVRRSAGKYQRSPTSDNIDRIVNALCRPDAPDLETSLFQRGLAVSERAQEGIGKPEESVDQSVLARTPYRSVYGRNLTDAERELIESRMTEFQLETLREVEAAFVAYARAVNRQFTLHGEAMVEKPEPAKPSGARQLVPFRGGRQGFRRGIR